MIRNVRLANVVRQPPAASTVLDFAGAKSVVFGFDAEEEEEPTGQADENEWLYMY